MTKWNDLEVEESMNYCKANLKTGNPIIVENFKTKTKLNTAAYQSTARCTEWDPSVHSKGETESNSSRAYQLDHEIDTEQMNGKSQTRAFKRTPATTTA